MGGSVDTEKHDDDMEHALWRVDVVLGLWKSHQILSNHDDAWHRKEADFVVRLEIAKQKLAELKAERDRLGPVLPQP